ncbi:hypothetical protein Desku_0082 [Desulfofundulus kuznetsovii DSM 6115]|uniref:Uncharacterized protein n=1 Tax=Desulfofundulus kuznetsovii (strain DSM 6115 / VKM B-1805 / 17) TaxID=760568 RepID=A0AAU8P9E2_DESK7|nr:hypothetical protein Desku_0082 [Desulfofundulus kuznetsovii DSM 6115]
MAEEKAAGHNLEHILFSLLDYQSKQGATHDDTMLMLGLLNLLGIVSLMNKQMGGVVSRAVMADPNPMLNTLLQMMGGMPGGPPPGQPPTPEQNAPPLPLNPALLMALMNQQPGQGPDPAVLLSLLGSMMGAQGAPPRRPPPAVPATMDAKKTVSPSASPPAGGGEVKQKVVKWGSHLEKEKRA